LLNLEIDEINATLHNHLIQADIFPVVNQGVPGEFGGAKSDQENSCVRHKLSRYVEMPL
jgi:hypothetical protein